MRHARGLRRGVTLAAVLVCGAAGAFGAPRAGAATKGSAVPAIAWSPCPSPAGYRCGSVRVPVDYAEPTGPSISLAVIEKPAADPQGSPADLVFNPGGPGESGVQILPVLAGVLPTAVVDRFNLVSFDERGTGASDRLACGPAPARVTAVDPVPARPGGPLPAASLYAGMAADCARAYPELLGETDTTAAAHDLDRIRQALGVARIDYWGLSYGTVLGALYARLFPTHAGAVILDGAVDPEESLTTQATQQAAAIAVVLRHAQAPCPVGATPCASGAVAATSFDSATTALSRGALAAPGDGDDVPVTLGDLDTATLLHLTVPNFSPTYGPALSAAAAGDGGPLRAVALGFELDLDGTSLVGPQWAYTCNDAAERPTATAAGRLASSLAARFGPVAAIAVTYSLGGCLGWPAARQAVTNVRSDGAPTVLVIGNTGDPNTPHAAAVALTGAIGAARLVTWDGWGHTWLLNGSTDPCMQGVVTAYLTSGHLPGPGTTCR